MSLYEPLVMYSYTGLAKTGIPSHPLNNVHTYIIEVSVRNFIIAATMKCSYLTSFFKNFTLGLPMKYNSDTFLLNKRKNSPPKSTPHSPTNETYDYI